MNENTTENINTIDPNEINWTNKELEIWVKAGLVPVDLLNPSRKMELFDFLRLNKKALHAHYKRNSEDDHYVMTVPPQNEWHNAPDITVVDKRTGEVSVLEMAGYFELCEGVCLRIKAKELSDWEKETIQVKTLNKEQHETLKAALEKLPPEKPLSRKEIVTLIEEVRKPSRKIKKYRQSGHLVDQKLKYQQPETDPTLFDILMPETKQKIEESRIEVKAEGIKLSYAENKLVHALNLLLCEKSQHTNSKEDSFYSGNAPMELVPYGLPDQKAAAPVLMFRPAELYKTFAGTEAYSGADVKFIVETLYKLESKKVLIKYDRVKKIKEGKKTIELTDRIEDFQSLIKIVSFIPDLTNEEKSALDDGDNSIRESKGKIIIALNPIFRDQIDTKYIEFPEDSQRRLVIAAGGSKKVTASMQRLMEYMLRELSANRDTAQLNEDTLPLVLGLEKYVKQKRKKLLQERIERDVQAIINMGIILQVEKLPNSTGGVKWVFQLNKDYE